MRKLNKKGFTLIELLAVIVILGLLMAIAIPAVTSTILKSRKNTLVSTADAMVDEVITKVNSQDYGTLSDNTVTWYIPVSNVQTNSCVTLESGGTDPFGSWVEAYVVVEYDSDSYSYDYYFTFVDDAGYGMKAKNLDEVSVDDIVNPTPVKAKGGSSNDSDAVQITTQAITSGRTIKVLLTPSEASGITNAASCSSTSYYDKTKATSTVPTT